MKARWRKVMGIALVVMCMGVLPLVTAAQGVDIHGAWKPETYFLKDGSRLQVEGRIFFTQTDWTVLFFVIDDEGKPRRGSGEGGTYTLEGEQLVFTHLFNLSAGEEVGSLPASPLRYEVRDSSEAPTEPCRVEASGDRMSIHFPSGNRMSFQRSSRF